MTSSDGDLEPELVSERDLWKDGPPHELFRRLRRECPVRWTERITEYREEAGYWSLTTADEVHTVSRDWRGYSSAGGGVTAVSAAFPPELTRAMFIGMDPPKHDRIKAVAATSASAPRSPGSSSASGSRRPLARFPAMELAGAPRWWSLCSSTS